MLRAETLISFQNKSREPIPSILIITQEKADQGGDGPQSVARLLTKLSVWTSRR